MNLRFIVLCGLIASTTLTATAQQSKRPKFLRMFSRQQPTTAAPIDGQLTEDAGPFLILASTLVGDGSKERADALAAEIRQTMKLPTFIYNENFDFTKDVSFDPQTSRRTRYANSYQYDAYAVLVGEYDSLTHPSIEVDLQRIKRAKSAVLADPEAIAAETDRSNPVTTLKNISNQLMQLAQSQGKDFGPMAHAFVTRNPLLPEDFFHAPAVDSFVRELNEDCQYSLLDCDAKYTVIVKTFRGTGQILSTADKLNLESSEKRMAQMKQQADEMVNELRSQDVEAYQYHDRTRSMVTIGGFASLGQELPDGKFQYDAGIRDVMSRYSALNVRPELARQVPKGSRGVAANAVNLIPFDVQPTPIAIPKVSKRSLYGANRR